LLSVTGESFELGDSMDFLERALQDRSGELMHRLTGDVGFTRPQAEDFLRVAATALLASYEWQADHLERSGLSTTSAARDLLAAIPGDKLAAHVGVSSRTAWDGLRTLVPSILESRSGDYYLPAAPEDC
jgi:hypothetical protein